MSGIADRKARDDTSADPNLRWERKTLQQTLKARIPAQRIELGLNLKPTQLKRALLAPDSEQSRSESERCEYVRAVLFQLPREQRTIIELAFFQGLTHSAIASHTGLSLGTIKWRIRGGMMHFVNN